MKIFGLTNHRELPKENTSAGDKLRRTFRWKFDEKGNKVLIPDEEIDQNAEIQSYLEETKIENIIRRATFDPAIAERLCSRLTDAEAIDYTDMPSTLAEAQNLMIEVEQTWNKLPREIKAKYDNDVHKFTHDFGTVNWAKNLGLLVEKQPEAPEKEVKE